MRRGGRIVPPPRPPHTHPRLVEAGDPAGSQAALEASRGELRRVIGRLVTAEEEARRRLARELHDDLGQRVAALALELRVVRRKLPEGDAQRIELDGVGVRLAELAEDLRRLSHDLHPSTLERRGLPEALADLCDEIGRLRGLPVQLDLRGTEITLPAQVALGLFRIAQEALSNTVRHAAADRARVSLAIDAEAAHLTVEDDGVGFEADPSAGTAGLGLASMEERARWLGGLFRIASAPGEGTELVVIVPLSKVEAPAASAPDAADPRLPRHVGPYQLLEEIGSGSRATVYLAREPEPLGRSVALKIHRGPLPGRWETLRFRIEQAALARLQHPAIAQVYDSGTTEDGSLFIAMEFVPGLPLTAYCDRHRLDIDRRIGLFAAICDGVQHAHRKGILHRDLKPSNVLVVEDAQSTGARAAPKIIDFGLAKALDRPLAESTVRSAEELVGTPAYLAPEALGGRGTDVRSEVYSLGALLYELLTGTVPVEIGAGISGLAEWVESVSEGNLVPPSRRIRDLASRSSNGAMEVARRRGFDDPRKLSRRLAGDLDHLLAQALALDPADRYATVEDLRREVVRVLQGEPVEAGPPDLVHRFGRAVRRQRRFVASAALVTLALGGGLFATTLQARRARLEATRADAVAQFLESLFQASDPRTARGRVPDTRELLRRGTERLGSELHGQPLLRARLLETLGGIHTELGLFDEARPLLEEALRLRERVLGRNAPEVADTWVRLGTLAHLSGKGDAPKLFARALAIREEKLGTDTPEVADLLNKLGTALAARGNIDEAEPVLRRALAVQTLVWGERDPRVAKVLHNLGGIAYYRRRIGEAGVLLRRALAIREAVLPADDPDLAGSLEALALVEEAQGKPATAERLLERQIRIQESIYGPEHPELAHTLINLGNVRRHLGRDAAAREPLERAVAVLETKVGPTHPDLVQALALLADLHTEHRRYALAEPLYRRLMRLRDRGATYSDWEQTVAHWAALLRATGRADEAARIEARQASAAEGH